MSGTRHWKPFDPSVATALEALAAIAPPEPVRSLRQGTKANALRRARTCYHHLSGRLGVALMAALLDRGLIVKGTDGDPAGSGSLTAPGQHITYSITNAGRRELSDFGLDLIEVERHHPSIHPILHGLIRATPPPRRAFGQGRHQPPIRPRLDPAHAHSSRGHPHRRRPERPARHLRDPHD